MDKLSFGDWLDQEIKAQRISQSELARRADLSRTAISDYVNGKRLDPDKKALQKLAHGLKLPVEEVYRAAGILPAVKPRSERVERLVAAFDDLNAEEQEEILDWIEFKKDRKRQEQERALQKRGRDRYST